MPKLTPSHWLSLHGLVTVTALLVYVLVTHTLRQRRQPSAAIGWVLAMFLLPYVALPIFLLVGSRKRARPDRCPASAGTHRRDAPSWLVDLAAALGQPSPERYGALAVHADGTESLDRLFELIDSATSTIDVCTFLIGRDRVGDRLLLRLEAKARAGIRVRLLLDGVGRMLGGWTDLSGLQRAGVDIRLFGPLLNFGSRGRTNLRNHRKLVVADAGLPGERLWCGGRNLAAEYFTGSDGVAPWHDLTLDLRGSLVGQAADLFQRDWDFASMGEVPAVRARIDDRGPIVPPASGEETGQLIASGPDQADDTVHTLLVSAGYLARERIRLVTPYLVLDDSLLLSLCMAARRGVQVDLLLPAKSNHRLADLARHRSLRALAASGVRVWLAPRMIHAKAVIIDEDIALAGSVNLDNRSLFLNYELMVAIYGRADVAALTAWFERERVGAQPYAATLPGLWRDFAEGLVLWVGFQL